MRIDLIQALLLDFKTYYPDATQDDLREVHFRLNNLADDELRLLLSQSEQS